MNEFEKALYDIEHNTLPYPWSEAFETHQNALKKALKKQIPKAVEKREIDEGVFIYVCPICGKWIPEKPHCQNCGRKLKWR